MCDIECVLQIVYFQIYCIVNQSQFSSTLGGDFLGVHILSLTISPLILTQLPLFLFLH